MSVPVDPHSREDGFEHHDANVRGLLLVGFGLLAALALALAGVGLLIGVYASRPEAPITALERDQPLPPPPRLEGAPPAHGQAVLDQGLARLEGYGWVDREQGVAHIPLARAEALLRERGWPAPAEPLAGDDPRRQRARAAGEAP